MEKKLGLLLMLVCFAVIIGGCGDSSDDDDDDNDDNDDDDTADDDTTDDDYDEMVSIPAGWFRHGCAEDDAQCEEDETPGFEVYLDAFSIDVYEVTVGQYRACYDAGACTEEFQGNIDKEDDLPIAFVTWNQADIFCKWVGKRLPTEAEWEKAARGDSQRIYPWGDQWEPTWLNWFDDVNDDDEYGEVDGYWYTAPVWSFPEGESPYGLLNMAGNVWEWTADWYDEDYYLDAPDHNPAGPDDGEFKVTKGGGWHLTWGDDPRPYRISDRDDAYGPDGRNDSIGFRCACSEGECPDL